MPDPAATARAAFIAAFHREPTAGALAPARVNLLGDHTDYNAGLAIPIAIDRTCACWVATADDPIIRAFAIDKDGTATCPTGRSNALELRNQLAPWARLACGAAAITLDYLKQSRGVHLAFSSDIPPGSGLSSSAAICISIATAIESACNTTIDPLTLARLCQRTEHEFAHTPCGLLDQLAILHAREHCALRINFADLTLEHVPIPPAARFCLIDTNTTHDNASGEYAARRRACESLARELNLPSVSAIDPDRINHECAHNDDHRWRLARHVVTENARVDAFAEALAAADLPRAGEIMNESHASLANDYNVSLPAIDTLAERVRNTPGVLGCRLTGAGLGGSLVALTDAPDTIHTLAQLAPAKRITPGTGRQTLS